ncbi:hypothetical protein DOY81_002487 [Sarcophaga bullata]|nr:hypothetical protein DOY81_002487 [Sarcophaga bullata]
MYTGLLWYSLNEQKMLKTNKQQQQQQQTEVVSNLPLYICILFVLSTVSA